MTCTYRSRVPYHHARAIGPIMVLPKEPKEHA